jgi:hypothetical protein
VASSSPLGLRAETSLSAAQAASLSVLDAYDLGPIAHRLRVKTILPEPLIAPAVLEFRRFLALHALLERPPPMYSQPVDTVWHTTLMFTRRYAELCDAAFGRPLHHRPTAGHEFGAPTASPDVQARFGAFSEVYERYFGPIHPLWTYDRPWAVPAD